MKLRNLFLGACSLVLAFTACDELMQLGGGSGNPDLSVDTTEMEFEVAGGDQTLTLSSTRAWKVETDADWVTVDPASGDAGKDQTVTVSVLENTGLDRSVDLKFTIGMISKYLTVNQKGPSGSADALIAYANDFDIEKAQNNSGWPYLDSNTNLWDNKKGTGASTVTYEYGGKMSVRTSGKLSNNNEGFSHYSGSGMNKVFFGAATSIFKINNITLGSGNNYTLSYGGQKYLQGADCNYSFDEMKVYVSNDAQKWVPVTMAFPADADIDGDWNLATGNFTLPEGTSTLSIAFVCTASSAYSIDDVLLQVSDTAGQAIDFSAGTAIDGTTPGGGNTGGDTTGQPATLQKVTIAEFLAAAEDDTWYELTGEIISIAKEDYGNFTIKDATDEVYIYGMTSKWVGSNDKSFSQIGLKVGDTVTLGTKRGSYNGTPQGGGNPVPAYYISHVAGEGSGDQGEVTPPAGGSAMTVAEVLAYSGALPAGTTVEGVVISNMALNNLTSKKGMYIQDATAGLQFYLAANHTFAFGDKVQIDLSGVTVGAYNGAVQVSGIALEKITKVSSGNTVTAKTVSMADFLANKYEGQYVALEGVQVAASDLSKTWGDASKTSHVSINMEDANGNKFVVFSSRYSTYGATAVAQGSGTIKGISSINNGTLQIIFAQESDFAGLTGNRFDGTVVTPPAGGDDDEPVTPPAGDATVAKLVMNTLGLANAAVVDGKEIKVDDNITLVFKKGGASTAPAYYDASQGIRMYQNGATLDVKAAAGKTISSIKFTFDYKQWYFAPDSGTLSAEADVRTWTGSANAVKFTSTGTDKNHRAYIKEIEVTYY